MLEPEELDELEELEEVCFSQEEINAIIRGEGLDLVTDKLEEMREEIKEIRTGSASSGLFTMILDRGANPNLLYEKIKEKMRDLKRIAYFDLDDSTPSYTHMTAHLRGKEFLFQKQINAMRRDGKLDPSIIDKLEEMAEEIKAIRTGSASSGLFTMIPYDGVDIDDLCKKLEKIKLTELLDFKVFKSISIGNSITANLKEVKRGTSKFSNFSSK